LNQGLPTGTVGADDCADDGTTKKGASCGVVPIFAPFAASAAIVGIKITYPRKSLSV
jgi:hypothetical protein